MTRCGQRRATGHEAPGLLRWSALLALFLGAAAAAHAQSLTVFAAASLRNALDEVGQAYSASGSARFVGSYASSSTLARQIERGAPADVFVSADIAWMDYVEERKAIAAPTRVNLLRNRLVLIAPGASTLTVTMAKGFPLAQLIGDGRLAMGDPYHVPAGIYGRAALESLGIWQSVAAKTARADNVRAALALVARGEAPLGIVYRTDAAAERSVRVLGEFPAGSHPDIIYPAAVVTGTRHRSEALSFMKFLRTKAAGGIFEKHGFILYRP